MEPHDTDPRAHAFLIDRLRQMSDADRLRRTFDLSDALWELAAARIRTERGTAISERELRLRLASLRLERATLIKAFGWDPAVQGY